MATPETDQPPSTPASPATQGMPGHLLRRCHQIAVAIFLEECSALDLTPLQFAVLAVLAEKGAQDQVTLGGNTALDRTTVTVVVRKLEELGLVGRGKSSLDQRSKIVQITGLGQTLLAKALPLAEAAQVRILAPLDAAESQQLLALLEKLADTNNHHSRAPIRPPKPKLPLKP